MSEAVTPAWDPLAGLWAWDRPGHTKPVADLGRVHSAPVSAACLLRSLQGRLTSGADPGQALAALRRLQPTSGPLAGCPRWYLEEPEPVDSNAAFFVGLPLIVIACRHRQQLDATAARDLDALLDGLATWFLAAVRHRSPYYPNKYMGDLVCAWLLHEQTGRGDREQLAEAMADAAAYWRAHAWGWGEHLSDYYDHIMLDELAALLLLSDQLPADLRTAYTELARDLSSLGDFCADGPRVPAVRSYAFTHAPRYASHRSRTRGWSSDTASCLTAASQLGRDWFLAMDGMRHPEAWESLLGPAPVLPAVRSRQVPCYGGARATMHIEPGLRLGSLSRWPFMPEAEAQTWGLSWQSFPVALWSPAGDWAFLQWAADEGGRVRCHPAEDKCSAYLGNALSAQVVPPIVGETYALQRGASILVLRLMRRVAQTWDQVEDRLRVLTAGREVPVVGGDGVWSQLTLCLNGRDLAVRRSEPQPVRPTQMRNRSGGFDWGVGWDRPALSGRRALLSVWGISTSAIGDPPRWSQVERNPPLPCGPGEEAWDLAWDWADTSWRVRIDPLATDPLRDLTS